MKYTRTLTLVFTFLVALACGACDHTLSETGETADLSKKQPSGIGPLNKLAKVADDVLPNRPKPSKKAKKGDKARSKKGVNKRKKSRVAKRKKRKNKRRKRRNPKGRS